MYFGPGMEALPSPQRFRHCRPRVTGNGTLMSLLRKIVNLVVFASLILGGLHLSAQDHRWTEDQAAKWYAQQPWLVGANFVPSDAVNELEMWQAASFDPKEIDREFGWAESIGMNTMRVFLHNLVWEEDPAGFNARLDQFPHAGSQAPHPARPRSLRFLLGSKSEIRTTASSDSRGA